MTTSVWFSPPLPGTYNVSKLIISEKILYNGQPALQNHAVLFEATEYECLEIVQEFARAYGIDPTYFDLVDVVRANPFMLLSDIDTAVDTLSELIDDPKGWDDIKTKRSLQMKRDSIFLAELFYDQHVAPSTNGAYKDSGGNKDVRKIFGTHAGSCPPRLRTAFRTLFEGVRILCCRCPFCLEEVEAEIYDGIIHCTNPGCLEERKWED